MKSIHDLADSGVGKSCVVIGGGLSVRHLDIRRVPKHWDIIGLNQHRADIANIIFYYDINMRIRFDKQGIREGQKLIGPDMDKPGARYLSKYCTHKYSYYDCKYHGDIGIRSLQFLDQILNYSNIYLAGFDYTHDNKSYHFEEDRSNPYDLERFTIYSMGVVLPLYEKIEWKNNIKNLNPHSQIKKFEFSGLLDKSDNYT